MQSFSLNISGRPVFFDRPAVMGIINATDNSFFASSRVSGACEAAKRALAMKEQGADMIDIGACSTRPGSLPPDPAEEIRRLEEVIPAVRQAVGTGMIISVDTYRAEVACKAVELGADIINDISAGALDDNMFDTVARLGVPYIIMHSRGTPADMGKHTDYGDVTADVIRELSAPLARLEELGVNDVIIDPGFGFAKTLDQNYSLLHNLEALSCLHRPVLVGMSRKSMATGLLGISPSEALPATCVLNALALLRGAAILRVHDVAEARRTIDIINMDSAPVHNLTI